LDNSHRSSGYLEEEAQPTDQATPASQHIILNPSGNTPILISSDTNEEEQQQFTDTPAVPLREAIPPPFSHLEEHEIAAVRSKAELLLGLRGPMTNSAISLNHGAYIIDVAGFRLR
jgi:hypothetical protein